MLKRDLKKWVCPTGCGCVIELRTDWIDSKRDGVLDMIEFDGASRILAQCASHAALIGPRALYDELRHFRGTIHRPDTCKCSLMYWWDDRVPEEQRVHTPVNHPDHTRQCGVHKHLTDHVAHHDAVTLENRTKNLAVGAVAHHLGWVPAQVDTRGNVTAEERNSHVAPHTIPWTYDADGQLLIGAWALGADPVAVAAVVAAAVSQPVKVI